MATRSIKTGQSGDASADLTRSAPSMDGRRMRSARSRTRILQAVREALSDPEIEITPEAVAARAGVSLSTIFRHFGDVEGLSEALRQSVAAEAAPLLAPASFEGPLRERAAELVRRRSSVYELVGPLRRASRRARRRPRGEREIQEQFEAALGAQLQQALRSELDLSPASIRHAVATLLSIESWHHLRNGRRLAAQRAAAVLVDAIVALLGPEQQP